MACSSITRRIELNERDAGGGGDNQLEAKARVKKGGVPLTEANALRASSSDLRSYIDLLIDNALASRGVGRLPAATTPGPTEAHATPTRHEGASPVRGRAARRGNIALTPPTSASRGRTVTRSSKA